MNKTVEFFAVAAGIIAFLIALSLSSSETISGIMEWLNLALLDYIGIIKAILAFLVVSVLAKITLGKIYVSMVNEKRRQMTERMKIMQKQQKENEAAKNKA